jgi:hypothetical protein
MFYRAQKKNVAEVSRSILLFFCLDISGINSSALREPRLVRMLLSAVST